MLGLAAAAWGVHLPRSWLMALLAGLLVVMLWSWNCHYRNVSKEKALDNKETDIDSTSGSDDTTSR